MTAGWKVKIQIPDAPRRARPKGAAFEFREVVVTMENTQTVGDRVLHGYLDTFGYLPFSSMHLMDTYRYSCLQILLSADTQLSAVSADRVLSADT